MAVLIPANCWNICIPQPTIKHGLYLVNICLSNLAIPMYSYSLTLSASCFCSCMIGFNCDSSPLYSLVIAFIPSVCLPTLNSQVGDSIKKRIPIACKTDGTAASPSIHLHLSPRARQTTNASSCPIVIQTTFVLTSILLIDLGAT